jgi:hypothetical protein
MSPIRIGALCMLFTAPLLLGAMDGVVLCICDSGIHFETPHEGSCRAECSDAGSDNARICGHARSCTDVALGRLAPVFSDRVSGKRIVEKPQCQDQASCFARQDAILARSCRAVDPTPPADSVPLVILQSSILLI